MRVRRRELTLAGQFFALQLVVVALLLVAVGVFAVRQSTASFASDRGSQLRSVAEYVANLSVVRDQLSRTGSAAADSTRSTLAPSVARAVDLSGADEVLIASPAGRVLVSSQPTEVGGRAPLGDSDVRRGRGWTGDVVTAGHRSVAGHAPIIADDGTLVGLALAEQAYPSVWDRLTAAGPDLLLFLGLGALLGGAGTFGVSRVVKRRTQGMAASEIAHLADHREALLHSIREGVVAVGTDRRVTMMNDAARGLLGVGEDVVGRPVDELGLDPHVVELLSGSTDAEDAVALVGTRVVVVNRRAASSRGRGIGSVTTMRDRTELVSLRSQLSSNLSITDTLRAQTHEFANQLHTISGLVQLEEYDEVTSFIGTLTRRRAEITELVAERIDDAAVAALLIAKQSVAAERGVELLLDAGSRLRALPAEESADLTTVLGNLVDNAVDAAVGSPRPCVRVGVVDDAGTVLVRVADTGPGVPEELEEAIFVRGFSSKPDVVGGRGIGLPLVRLICTQRGGRVRVDRDAATGGAVFDVELPVGALR